MSWIDSAILAAAIMAAVNVIDSHLISRRLPSLWSFLFPVGIFALLYGSIVYILQPLPEDVGAGPIGYAVIAGCIRALGIGSFLYAMQKSEVSRIIPVVNMHPVFVAAMAFPLLGEDLAGLEWLAIIITVAGAVMISIRRDAGHYRFTLNRYTALPFLAALCLAGSNLTLKYALADIDRWNAYAISALIWGVFCIGVSVRLRVVSELRRLARPVSTMSILAVNETLAPVAIILLYWSIERGPVSLVSTIAVTQAAFVLLYAMILGWISSGALLERRMNRSTIFIRAVAIGLIVGGVTIIHLL